ncbi:MAG: winged helix-turn-helix domain-containing protein [Cellulosilyticaceae bacterium]
MQNGEKVALEYVFSLKLKKQEIFFGPGVAQTLELIEATGSLHKAAESMKMAYSKAWKIIKLAEKNLEYPLIARQVGGTGGGGSVLTPEGKKFLETYRAFEKDAKEKVNDLFNEYFIG